MHKILLVAGNLDPAYSYEFHNFLKPLEKMGHKVLTFDFIKSMNDKSISYVLTGTYETTNRRSK